MSQACPDLIAFLESPSEYPDRWVLMNVFTRQCLGAGPEVFSALAGPEVEARNTYRIWNIWRFSHIDGLLSDPSRFKRDASKWGDPQIVDHGELVKQLKAHCLLIDDYSEYRSRFDFKKTLVDRQHFGNYHQQLGQQLIAFERLDPSAWWLQQKFTPDLSGIRQDNLYGAVQDRFLDAWLPHKVGPGVRVLDLGCGAGTITRKMARLGASVLGVDPNPDYIRLASEGAEGDSCFQVLDLDSPGGLDALPSASFDCIFMSDALLFYFVPYEHTKPLNLKKLIFEIKRLLKPGGSFLSLEPHPVFYVQPWFGDPERPFTVMTEYLHTKWRINPPLSVLAQPFLEAGFQIINIEEPASDPQNKITGSRDAHFASEFPVWLLMEFQAAPQI